MYIERERDVYRYTYIYIYIYICRERERYKLNKPRNPPLLCFDWVLMGFRWWDFATATSTPGSRAVHAHKYRMDYLTKYMLKKDKRKHINNESLILQK